MLVLKAFGGSLRFGKTEVPHNRKPAEPSRPEAIANESPNKFMKNLLILVTFLGTLCTCSSPSGQEKEAGRKGPPFQTTPPSHLYFKNIRSIHYAQKTQPGTRIDLYKLRRFSETRQRPVLYPVIVDNWMQDEAYLLIQPNDFDRGFSDPLRVFWKTTQDSGRYELALADWNAQHRFAGQLYRSIQQEHRLSVETAAGNRAPLFERNEDRLHFTTTLRDFYKLTEKK